MADAFGALKTAVARSVGTPAVVVDLDVVDRNIARVQAHLDGLGIKNRPHIKTHKNPRLALAQIAAGAAGVACQKLGEAEVMLDAGVADVLVCTNLISAARSGAMTRLLRRARFAAAADNPTTLAAYAEAATAADAVLDVVVECDTGRKRAGVVAPAEAVALARQIADAPGLAFKGLMLYPPGAPWTDTQAFLDATLAGLRDNGLTAEIVSTGGTPNLADIGALRGQTEHRAGTYVFNDRMMLECGAATPEDLALTVFTTVVSRAEPGRGVLDAGSKTLTSDAGGGLDGFGLILEHPDATIAGFAEEHGMLDLSACARPPAVGDVVRVVPNHVCVVVNMMDRLVGVRGGRIAEILDVAGRGKLV